MGELKLLSTSEAARLVGVSADTIRRAARLGQLRIAATTTGGRERLFVHADMVDWQKRRRQVIPAPAA